MEPTKVNLREPIMSQATGQTGLAIVIHRYSIPIWIGLILFIFLVLDERLTDVAPYYATFGGVLALHTLLVLVALLRIGGPLAQPGYLVCTDEGLHMQYCNSRGRWKREKTIPWADIRGAMGGPFEDVTQARARTTGSAVGSGANVGIKTRHVGLILFFGQNQLKRQVWLNAKALGEVTRAEMTATVDSLKTLVMEIEEHLRAAGHEPIAAEEQQKLLEDQGIKPLQKVSGHSPRSKKNPPIRIKALDFGLLLAFALAVFLMAEIFRIGPMFPTIRAIAGISTSQSALRPLGQDIEAHMMQNDTSVSGMLRNPNSFPVQIDRIMLHGFRDAIDITDYLRANDRPLSDPIIIDAGREVFISARPPRMFPRPIRPLSIEISRPSTPRPSEPSQDSQTEKKTGPESVTGEQEEDAQ